MKLKVTFVAEYEPNSEHYGTDDPAEMARIDLENWQAEPEMLLASFEYDDFTVTVEPA